MRNRLLALSVVSLLLSGCVTTPQKWSISATFDVAQARSLLSEGSNTVRGSALVRQRGGGVVSCAGREVLLVPATTYASERVGAIYGSGERGYNPAGRSFIFDGELPEYWQMQRKTMCDAQGYFKFDKVANGTFYVVTMITWQVNDYSQEGGALMHRVSLAGDESREVVLAP